MRNYTVKMIALALLSGATAFAGSYTSDFSNPNATGFTLSSGTTAALNPYPFIQDGKLTLTPAENNLAGGSFVLDDLDAGLPISAFTANFKLQLGPGSGTPADGGAFAFSPNVMPGGTWSETGPDTAGGGLSVCFDIYNNGGEAPAWNVVCGGVTVATKKFTGAEMITGKMEDVSIQVNRNGLFSLSWKGQVVFTNLLLTAWTPTAGLFGFSARTGGENAVQAIDDLSITTTKAGTSVAPTITTQPLSQTVNEGATVSFSVGWDGSAPFTFQWTKNSADITDATKNEYTISRVYAADNNAQYAVKVTNEKGTATSQAAVLQVNADTTAPTIVSAKGSADFKHATITFSEPMGKASAEITGNYQITGLTVSAAAIDPSDDRNVVLTTSQQAENTDYPIQVSNVKDDTTAGNTIAANSSVTFHSYAVVTGIGIINVWDGYAAGISGLEAFIEQGQPPTRQLIVTSAQSPSWENGSTYGARFEGVFIAPETGDVTFYIASDDQSFLYLSTDDTAANLGVDPIASVTGWTNQREWTKEGGQMSSPVSLIKGKKYFFRALQVEGTGGDGVAVGWELPSAPGAIPVIPGSALVSAINTMNSIVNISKQPVDTQVVDGKTAKFTVAATGSSDAGNNVLYQWQKNGQDIAGATTDSYTTPALALTDSGARYKVLVSVPGKTVASTEVTLSVVPDTFPPTVIGVGSIKQGTGYEVGVNFDEAIVESSATSLANYTLSSGTVTAVKVYPKSPGVVLTVTGLTAGSKYTLTIKDVADLKNNKIGSVSKEFTASTMQWGVVGANEMGLENGVVPVGNGGFDIYSDGIGEWGTYDEATFVYEEVTGDFDKKLRVEFQDLSSQWARAGLIAREVLNFGVDRATQTGDGVTPGAAGRYQKVHVNPVGPTMTGPGTAGNQAWEGNNRVITGAATTTAGGSGVPQYPNAWCRLQRVGQTLTIYRSDDGINWTQLGSSTFPNSADPNSVPLPDKLYVGPEYSPENGNITNEGDRGVWLAKMRDYGDYLAVIPPPTMTYEKVGTGVKLTFEGSLQWATNINGIWYDMPDQTPCTINCIDPAKFYRAKK